MCNTSAKRVIQCKLHIEILDYDWLMNNRVWSGPMKSFVFKSSLRPRWRNLWHNFSLIAWYACVSSVQARAILLVFEKFTRAYLFQIALEIMWLPILIITNIFTINLSPHGRSIGHLQPFTGLILSWAFQIPWLIFFSLRWAKCLVAAF